MEPISPELISAIKNNDHLIPFIGAGFSANIDGYPLWDDFILMLEDELNSDLEDGAEPVDFIKMFGESDPAESTQYYYWSKGCNTHGSIANKLAKGKNKFRDSVISRFKTPPGYNKDIFEQHLFLIKKFKKIYTTNWDDLLEHTCVYCEEGFGYSRITAPLNKTQYGGQYKEKIETTNKTNTDGRREIIKYHGCHSDGSATSIVASTADYFQRISLVNEHPLDKQIAFDMKNNDFIFFGYSLRDVNVKYLLNQINFYKWGNFNQDQNKVFYLITFDDHTKQSANRSRYLNVCNYIRPITLCNGCPDSVELLNLNAEYMKIADERRKLLQENKRDTEEWKDMLVGRKTIIDKQRVLRKRMITKFLNEIS